MKNNVCIIPARGGSKRIPKKNIKKFIDKPIIEYSIENAINSNIFDRIIVSTDDAEIFSISEKAGADVLFRSEKNSNDHSTTMDVLVEVMSELSYENICCLYPTSSLINYQDLIESFESFKIGKFNTLVSCVKYSHPIQRALELVDGRLKMINSENINIRTQDLSTSYHDAGQFYWIKDTIIREQGKIFTENTGYYLLNELNAQDIDNIEDWKIAELKYKYLYKIL